MKNKKSNNKILELDLHHLNFTNVSSVENSIELVMDKFLSPHLESLDKTEKTIVIIVGKGNNTPKDKMVKGVPALRYFTLEYLKKLGFVGATYSHESGKITAFI
jgi:hypothetical protein